MNISITLLRECFCWTGALVREILRCLGLSTVPVVTCVGMISRAWLSVYLNTSVQNNTRTAEMVERLACFVTSRWPVRFRTAEEFSVGHPSVAYHCFDCLCYPGSFTSMLVRVNLRSGTLCHF